jgi:cytochrome oxidase assembly protein ShyY1
VIWPLLRTRRWIGFTALVAVTIVAFGLLSAWQWSRAEQHRQERLALQAALAADPTPLDEIPLANGVVDEWRVVRATGQYLPDSQVVVRKRPQDARNGFWLMTALRTDDGSIVWVNRGWLPAEADALSTPDLPTPPAGQASVIGYLRAWEQADASANEGLPDRQIAAPAPALLPDVGDVLPAYVQLGTSDPTDDALIPVPVPDIDEGRNVSYAVQWLLFAAVAIAGWYFFLRREAIEDSARAAQETGTDPGIGEPVTTDRK